MVRGLTFALPLCTAMTRYDPGPANYSLLNVFLSYLLLTENFHRPRTRIGNIEITSLLLPRSCVLSSDSLCSFQIGFSRYVTICQAKPLYSIGVHCSLSFRPVGLALIKNRSLPASRLFESGFLPKNRAKLQENHHVFDECVPDL